MNTESNRVPSIHVTLPALKEGLRKVLPNLPITDDNYEQLAEELFKKVMKYNLNHRSITVTNERLERKLEKILKASKSDTDLVCNYIGMYRRNKKKTKLYSTTKITPEHKDYPKVKELTNIILNYSDMYNLEFTKAIINYLDYTIPKITSSLNFVHKLINMEDMVIQLTNAQLELDSDENINETLAIRDLYDERISEKTNIKHRTTEPTELVYFKEINNITDTLDIPNHIYIDAQFHGLGWTDSYPTPKQMVGEKATQRLQKYMYEKKIKVKQKAKDKETSVLDKLKNLKNDKNRDR